MIEIVCAPLRKQMSKVALTHVQRVRMLYKTILRLHRGLPEEMHTLGDIYVKDEFRRHKKCNQGEAAVFMNEWSVGIFF